MSANKHGINLSKHDHGFWPKKKNMSMVIHQIMTKTRMGKFDFSRPPQVFWCLGGSFLCTYVFPYVVFVLATDDHETTPIFAKTINQNGTFLCSAAIGLFLDSWACSISTEKPRFYIHVDHPKRAWFCERLAGEQGNFLHNLTPIAEYWKDCESPICG